MHGNSSLADTTMEVSSFGTGSVASSWDWQRELEVFAGRISRGRADEAAAARRASEEAERLALQRMQEAERRQLAWQSEESATLQTFLSGWHYAQEARWDQMTAQMAMVQKRAEEDSSQTLRSSTVLEALTSRVEKWETNFQVELQRLQDTLKEGQHRSHQQDDAVSRVTQRVVACEAELEMVKDVKEALFIPLEHRVSEVETRGANVAQTLRALEPFVEQVTARLEPLEPAIEGLRSELSASSQIHRTSIAAQGKQMEESLQALQAEVVKCQEETPRLMQAIQEAEAIADAATKQTTQLDIEMKEAAQKIQVKIQDVQEAAKEMATQQAKQMEVVEELRLSSFQSSTVNDLQSADEKLRKDLRREFQDGVVQAVAEAKESLGEKLQREVEMLQRELQKQLQELRSSSNSSAEQLRSLQKENQKLADAFERTKGKGISFEWKIPRCLQRLRYLSLLSEPGLWLDSDTFYLGSLGPLEMRLYTKGLRGGNGQCAIALRLAEAGQVQGIPLMVDLVVGERTRRAAQCPDPEGLESLVWLADSMGSLEEHLADDLEELILRTELPLLAAPTMLASRAPSSIGSVDDLRSQEMVKQVPDAPLRSPQAPGTLELKARSETRGNFPHNLRGVPSRDPGAPLPTLPIADPSGVFALRTWGTPNKATPPEELLSNPGANQRNPSWTVTDDVAR